jgi:hypothetical protein
MRQLAANRPHTVRDALEQWIQRAAQALRDAADEMDKQKGIENDSP